ncbi:MAG: VOC family protein, partial [Pseudomonadota bacterium]
MTIRIAALLLVAALAQGARADAVPAVDADASIADSPTSIRGLYQVGLVVNDLDRMLGFYRQATGFAVVSTESVANDAATDRLYGEQNVRFRRAVLQAPNLRLALTQFGRERPLRGDRPVQGPGMTHTCYQSLAANPGYDRFVDAGLRPLSRGDGPVDLGGYGVTYAYGFDPEGNMLELEQLSPEVLKRSGYDDAFSPIDHPLWMTQAAIATPD